MVGAFGMFADHVIELIIRLHLIARLDLMAGIGFERILRKDLAGQADAAAKIDPVLLFAHVVEPDHRVVLGVGAAQCDRAA